MENSNQKQFEEEEIPNPEQFQVGRVPSEDEDQQTGTEKDDDDDVELGFTNEAVLSDDDEPVEDNQNAVDLETDSDGSAGEAGDEDADFVNPDDDPA